MRSAAIPLAFDERPQIRLSFQECQLPSLNLRSALGCFYPGGTHDGVFRLPPVMHASLPSANVSVPVRASGPPAPQKISRVMVLKLELPTQNFSKPAAGAEPSYFFSSSLPVGQFVMPHLSFGQDGEHQSLSNFTARKLQGGSGNYIYCKQL